MIPPPRTSQPTGPRTTWPSSTGCRTKRPSRRRPYSTLADPHHHPKSISYALSTNNCVPYSWALFWWGFWGYTYISTNDTSWTLIQHTLAGTLERRRHDEDRQAATPRRMDGLQEQELPDHDTGLQPCKPCDPDTKLSKHNAWSPELKHHKHMQLMILSLPQVETALGVTSVQEKDINYEWMSSEVQLANDRPKQ